MEYSKCTRNEMNVNNLIACYLEFEENNHKKSSDFQLNSQNTDFIAIFQSHRQTKWSLQCQLSLLFHA